MRARPRVFAYGLVLVLLLAVERAPARAAEADKEELSNAVVITTPLAHAQDLLRLPGVGRVFEGSLKGSVDAATIESAQASLAKSGPFWPRELSLAMPSSSFSKIDGLGRVFMVAALCNAATSLGPKGKKDLVVLQKALIAELKRTRLPTLVISARFGDALTARGVAQMISNGVAGMLSNASVRLSTEGAATGVRVRVGQLMKPKAMASALVGAGWLSSTRDPQAKPLAATIAALEAEAWVASDGPEVTLTIGPAWRGKPPSLVAPPVKLAAGQLVAGARGETAPLRAMVAGWRALWGTWEKTAPAAAAKARADDEVDMLGDLERVERMLARSGDRWDGWLWADRGLHAIGRAQGVPALTPLASDPVAALLPGDTVAVDVDAATNLGERLSDLFSHIEDRLSRASLKEVLKVDSASPGPIESAELAYYKNFAKLRELVHGKGVGLFQGASALVIGGGTRVPKLEVRHCDGSGPKVFTAVPVPELALIGRAKEKDPQAAVAFVQEAWKAFGGGIRAVAGARPEPAPSPRAGVPAPRLPSIPTLASAQWLDASWLDDLVKWGVWTDGGAKLHVASRDDLVVLSTSPALTGRIFALRGPTDVKGPGLAVRVTPRPPLALPAPAGSLVAWSRYPCAPLAAQARDVLAIVDKVCGSADIGKANAGKANAGKSSPGRVTAEVGDIVSTTCNVVDGLTLLARQEAATLETRVDVPAAAALYRPVPKK